MKLAYILIIVLKSELGSYDYVLTDEFVINYPVGIIYFKLNKSRDKWYVHIIIDVFVTLIDTGILNAQRRVFDRKVKISDFESAVKHPPTGKYFAIFLTYFPNFTYIDAPSLWDEEFFHP